jgi:hypothetical protein
MPTKGRVQVAPGQVIQSAAWGNPLWDQSVQAFANAADRTAQFPLPQAGAVTYLMDVDRVQMLSSGGTWYDLMLGKNVNSVQSGSPVVTLSPSGVATITFSGPGFKAAPVVVVTMGNTNGLTFAPVVYVDAGTVGNTGFNIVVRDSRNGNPQNGGGFQFFYTAIGVQ